MSKIQALHSDTLPEAPSSPGITRQLAFDGEGHLVVHSRVDPGVASGWHHHGDYDVYGFVVAGSARFEYGPGGKEAVSVGSGDFFHVPAHLVHRDVNPSSDEGQELILFLRGTGQPVINVDGPEQT